MRSVSGVTEGGVVGFAIPVPELRGLNDVLDIGNHRYLYSSNHSQ